MTTRLVKLSVLNCTSGTWKIKSVELPSKVRLKRGVSYEIVRQSEIASDPDCMGLCDFDKRLIFIKSELSDSQVIETFIHELLHAISHEFALKIPHKLIYALEAPILKILRLNKWI